MQKSAFAKVEPGLVGAPAEPAQLRAIITRIIMAEYSGDICSEFWRAPARRAADRIVEIIRHEIGLVTLPNRN